ncbi:MAG: tyrosine--tRNA ligase [bacterium]
MPTIIDTLKARGLYEDQTSPELDAVLQQPTTMYIGYDPSSSSLQAGNFVAIMAMAHFQRAGHRVIALAGGATGLIGDPSGKSAERQLLTEEEVRHNLEGIQENLSRFLDFNHPTVPARLVNNYDWFKDFTFISFLRDVGKHFRMTQMLGKESVKKRMASDESGMSFTEFCYQLLQAYDFLWLHDHEGCRLQLGGSDQWGNITAGTELVRRMRGAETFGLTIPLVCDSQGRKFGKSEGNAVYLDSKKTSYYDFYQFFLRTTDADAARYLRIFTFLPLEQIGQLEEALQAVPEKREAQRVLAEEVTRCVHGDVGLTVARRASEVLFGGALDGLSLTDLLAIFANVPSRELPHDAVVGKPVLEVAAAAGLFASKGEARRMQQQGGLNLNNQRVADAAQVFAAGDLIEGRVAVLRAGKKNFCLVKIVAT